ncbi:MAG: alpha-glucan family phosphorylase [Bacteroidales bacterium]|nr:alpha-glucan family phosphorylase [Bacteroidales bacterium]
MKLNRPDYLFEISWEVCNKIGGIYTVISSKAPIVVKDLKERYFMIGPDVWKETPEHPDFSEDRSLLPGWRSKAEQEGLRLRVGRWNVPGKPIAILVDFTPFFPEKDRIFSKFWELYKLDSLQGQWDYVEPALFGYAAGKVIESFYEYYLSASDRVIAHFHEWMTGAGVLYLKDKVPQVGTVFTTHATVAGRAIAGNGLPLYHEPDKLDLESLIRRFGVVSKHSLEKTASQEADSFATVSEVTASECRRFLQRSPDIITPNGFDPGLIPDPVSRQTSREDIRNRIIRVAEAVLGRKIGRNAWLVLTSGRYEYRNKGIDLLIDALAKVRDRKTERQILVFFAIPAYQTGPRMDILSEEPKNSPDSQSGSIYLTHLLMDPASDQIISNLLQKGIHNKAGDAVNAFFIPAYLNGDDGIFNIPYYHFLLGFDQTVFPSYYEPWGYTPMESVAFGIPTITTSLAGFGKWVAGEFPGKTNAVTILDRMDGNDEKAVGDIAEAILQFAAYSPDMLESTRMEALEIAAGITWNTLYDHYREAYSVALEKVEGRKDLFVTKKAAEKAVPPVSPRLPRFEPEWRQINIRPSYPESMEALHKLAMNLWWSWNPQAEELFRLIDVDLWEKHRQNPLSLLDSLDSVQWANLEKNVGFQKKLATVLEQFNEYISQDFPGNDPRIAYFSMEYGLHESLTIYSGGLGVLAGDFLKEASDSNVHMIGVGILYRYGYFQQSISLHGDQLNLYIPQKFSTLPIQEVNDDKGNPLKISIVFPGRSLTARAWRVDVGRIPLYLLDTDIDENTAEDRAITYHLYGGDWENRFKQELLLGVGGMRLLDAMGVKPDILHLNEGHASFAGLERLRMYVQYDNLPFEVALEVVRSSSLFTTHTPVPAGHDTFSEDILRTYIPHYADRLRISWREFMNMGQIDGSAQDGRFSMSILAMKLCQEANGVSKIHERVTREIFRDLYPGYFPGELHIGHVTNGVHYGTWTARNWQELHRKYFGKDFVSQVNSPEHWERVFQIGDEELWEERKASKSVMTRFLKKKINSDLTKRQENPRIIIETLNEISEEALYIGFARRFATYKRAHLLFGNTDRLEEIVNDPERPVRFIFAGKAHPNDKPGQDLIQRIVTISKNPRFLGKVIFLENYDMHLARNLIAGVDVWLNTPTRPLEASGTSGQKAVMNGVLNLSVLDGWWSEGFKENAGWALNEARIYANQQYQDELDAETILNLLQEEIIPLFFTRNNKGIPGGWLKFVRNSMAQIAPHFTMKRMLDDYTGQYYHKLRQRNTKLIHNDYTLAREITGWKRKIRRFWDDIELVSIDIPGNIQSSLTMGQNFKATLVLKTGEIPPEEIRAEVIFGRRINDHVDCPWYTNELDLREKKNPYAVYECDFPMTASGIFEFAFRIAPKSPLLPYRHDLNLVRWF